MISGSSRRWLAALALAVSLGLAPAAVLAADSATLERLMALFAQVESVRAHFTERSELGLLSESVESSGTLSYVRPDLLEKRTLTPEAESLRVEGDRLTLVQPGGAVRTLSVSSVPEIEAYVESIRATHRGDLASLKRHYAARLEGSLERWQLFLEPRDSGLLRTIRRIVLSGSNAAITQMEIQQGNGDRTIMRIVPDPT